MPLTHAERVCVKGAEAVTLAEGGELPVPPDAEGAMEGVSTPLPLTEALSVAKGEAVRVAQPLIDGAADAAALPQALPEKEGEPEGERVAGGEREGERVGSGGVESEGAPEVEGAREERADALPLEVAGKEGVGTAEVEGCDAEGDDEGAPDAEGKGLTVPPAVALAARVACGEDERDGVADTE